MSEKRDCEGTGADPHLKLPVASRSATVASTVPSMATRARGFLRVVLRLCKRLTDLSSALKRFVASTHFGGVIRNDAHLCRARSFMKTKNSSPQPIVSESM